MVSVSNLAQQPHIRKSNNEIVEGSWQEDFVSLFDAIRDLESELPGGKLSGGDKAILWALARYAAGRPDRFCFPSRAAVAEAAGVTERTVTSRLQHLIDLGLIEATSGHRRPGRPEKSFGYRLLIKGKKFPITAAENGKDFPVSVTETGKIFTGKREDFSPLLIEETNTFSIEDKNRSADADRQAEQKANSRGSRLAVDAVLTPEAAAFAEKAFPEIDAAAEWEAFRDYWTAMPGARGRKTDWNATFRNWLRNAQKFRGGKANNAKSRSDADVFRESAEFYAAWPGE